MWDWLLRPTAGWEPPGATTAMMLIGVFVLANTLLKMRIARSRGVKHEWSLREFAGDALETFSRKGRLWLAVISPCCEEVLLCYVVRPNVGLWLSSLFFGLMHVDAPFLIWAVTMPTIAYLIGAVWLEHGWAGATAVHYAYNAALILCGNAAMVWASRHLPRQLGGAVDAEYTDGDDELYARPRPPRTRRRAWTGTRPRVGLSPRQRLPHGRRGPDRAAGRASWLDSLAPSVLEPALSSHSEPSAAAGGDVSPPGPDAEALERVLLHV